MSFSRLARGGLLLLAGLLLAGCPSSVRVELVREVTEVAGEAVTTDTPAEGFDGVEASELTGEDAITDVTPEVVPVCAVDADCDGLPGLDACSVARCLEGACTPRPVPGCCLVDADCVPLDPVCRVGSCPEPGMGCVFEDVCSACDADTDCDDADACTTNRCVQHQCRYEALPGCCTTDAQCADDLPCTADACREHVCESTSIPYCCASDAACDDGDPCTFERCVDGTCRYEAEPGCCHSDGECADGDACTRDLCAAVDGAPRCVHEPVPDCCHANAECDDHDPCTLDACQGSACVHAPVPNCGGCAVDPECDDGDACTRDVCDLSTGACRHEVLSDCCHVDASCDDGDPCTADLCLAHACVHQVLPECAPECVTAADCDDGDACTLDACLEHACVNEAISGCECHVDGDCADVNPCSKDRCKNGQCEHKLVAGCCQAPSDCSDGNACTWDLCDDTTCYFYPALELPGCCATAADCPAGAACQQAVCGADFHCGVVDLPGCCTGPAACDDGDPCTADTCQGGLCVHASTCCTSAADCSDGDPCTADTCAASGACVHAWQAGEGCCDPVLYAEGFDDGAADGFVLPAPAGGVGWQVVAASDAPSLPRALYLGNPATGTYANGGVVKATATSPSVTLAPNATHTLTLRAYLDVEAGLPYDDFRVVVVSGGVVHLGFVKTAGTPLRQWIPLAIDLTPFAGQTVQVRFVFDSVDELDNDGRGVLLDDLRLEYDCAGSASCATAADCDDGDACTADACAAGACVHEPQACGCVTSADCDDGDPCTVDACEAGACRHALDYGPGCCAEQNHVKIAFGDGTAGGLVLAPSDTPARWSVSKHRFKSGPASLYFGNPATFTYAVPGQASAGTATTPSLALPAGYPVRLRFALWLDVEALPDYDRFEVRVLEGAGSTTVWQKSALAPSEYKAWADVEVNLSGFAGRTVRVQFAFDSVDALENATEGVYLDDLEVRTLCQPYGGCAFDAECADALPCTVDACVDGACVHPVDPGCCEAPADCDDHYACTLDGCFGGQCVHEAVPDCCVSDVECADLSPCTADACVLGACVHEPVGGPDCCATAADCDDGDPCTADACAGQSCTHQALGGPGCCKPSTAFEAAFDDHTLQGFEVLEDGTGALWQVHFARWTSPPFSLYYGDVAAGSFDVGERTFGVATSPAFTVPAAAAGAWLRFDAWLDVEPGLDADEVNVFVISGGVIKLAWSRAKLPANSMRAWVQASADLTAYKGKSVRLQIEFDSVDADQNTGEGVYLDNLRVEGTCGP